MNTKQARLTTEELYQTKWLLGGILSLLSLWSLWALDLGTEGILLLGLALIVFKLMKASWFADLPPKVWRMAGPALVLIIVVDFALSVGDFLPPLVRMVALLLIYRALAPRRRREDLQLVLLCLFCLVISGALTVSLLFGLQILLFAPLAMALLFLICVLNRGPEREDDPPSWRQVHVRRLLRKLWRVANLKVLGVTALLFLIVVGVSALLFVVMPRFNLDQNIPFLQLSSTARSGFSEEVRLGEVTEITEDQSVALRVDVPSLEDVDPSPYWRMLVLDRYADNRFLLSPSLQQRRYRDYEETSYLDGWRLSSGDTRSGTWTFYLEGGTTRYLPLPGAHRGIRFTTPEQVAVTDVVYLRNLPKVRQNVFSYQVEDLNWNRRFPAWPVEVETFASPTLQADLRAASGNYPLTTLEIDLAPADRRFLSELNTRITGGGASLDALTYSQRVTDYLRQNFSYSLRPDGAGGGGDPIVNWLRSGSRGHCELFAGSFLLLARDAGFPARMVVGFAGGGWNAGEAYFAVRNRDAHAWVEIYYAPTQEWVRIDPTPGRGDSDPDAPAQRSFSPEIGWGAWVDSLRVQWYRRIINFEQEDQLEAATSLMDHWRRFSEAFAARARQLAEQIGALLERPFSPSTLLRLGIFLLIMAGLWALWRIRYAGIRIIARIMKRPPTVDPVRRRSTYYLQRFAAKEAQSRSRSSDEGRREQVKARLKALRFGPPVDERAARPVFNDARRILRRRFD